MVRRVFRCDLLIRFFLIGGGIADGTTRLPVDGTGSAFPLPVHRAPAFELLLFLLRSRSHQFLRLKLLPLDLGRFCRSGSSSFEAVEEVDEDRLVVKVALGEKGPGDDAEFVAEGAKDGLHQCR